MNVNIAVAAADHRLERSDKNPVTIQIPAAVIEGFYAALSFHFDLPDTTVRNALLIGDVVLTKDGSDGSVTLTLFEDE